MASRQDIVERYVDVLMNRTKKDFLRSKNNVFVSTVRPNPRYATSPLGMRGTSRESTRIPCLFSYGHHFELCRPLYSRSGRVCGWLLNGDRYSSSTTQHQWTVESAVRKSGLPHITIPYRALKSAGVDLDSIRILESLPARWVEVGARVDFGDLPLPMEAPQDWQRVEVKKRRHGWGMKEYTVDVWGPVPPVPEEDQYDAIKYRHVKFPDITCQQVRKRYDGYDSETGSSSYIECDEWNRWHKGGSIACDDQGYHYIPRQHRLGESVFSAVSNGRRRRYLSGWDHQERRPLYFLCELPRCTASTVEEAYEALKPDAVKLAEGMGRAVFRQGDIFAISLHNAEIPKSACVKRRKTEWIKWPENVRYDSRPEGVNSWDLEHLQVPNPKRIRLLGTNHVATEAAIIDGRFYARGCLYHDVSGRDADHARVKLGDGKTWFLVVKNTVPVDKPQRRRITA